jgi:hypothetical protein
MEWPKINSSCCPKDLQAMHTIMGKKRISKRDLRLPELQKCNFQTPSAKLDENKDFLVAIGKQATIFYDLC